MRPILPATVAAMFLVPPASAVEFTILLFEPASELALRLQPDQASPEGYWGAYGRFAQALIDRRALCGGTALATDAPSHMIAVEVREGGMIPGELRLSGYFVVEAPDLGAAWDLAVLAPTMTRGGTTEVRQSDLNALAGPAIGTAGAGLKN